MKGAILAAALLVACSLLPAPTQALGGVETLVPTRTDVCTGEIPNLGNFCISNVPLPLPGPSVP